MNYLVCEWCGKNDETVKPCIDPYIFEIDDREEWVTACEDCLQQRRDDI